MTTQLLPPPAQSVPRLMSAKSGRGIRVSSLRVGAFVKGYAPDDFRVVTVNSHVTRQIVVREVHRGGWLSPKTPTYAEAAEHFIRYVGPGHRRAWWAWLPKWVRGLVSEWSRP